MGADLLLLMVLCVVLLVLLYLAFFRLLQALGSEAGEHRPQHYAHQRLPPHVPPTQQEAHRPTSQRPAPQVPSQRDGPAGDLSNPSLTAASSAHNPSQRKRPDFLPTSASQACEETERVDMATSPLASPHGVVSGCRETFSRGPSSSSLKEYLHRDSASAGGASRHSNKPYIVRQTPYYNTSTQTDVQSYTDTRGRLCNVEIQVGEVSSQTSPKVEFEEKSIQARMSHEFQPHELDSPSPKKMQAKDKRNFFQYPFEGMQSIQAKYATDMDTSTSSQPPDVFSGFSSGDQASIMRKLSEEFYGGSKMGLLGEKRHSSASSQEHSPKPVDASSMSVFSGTMSQAESYSSVIIHPSESAGPFGRDDFGSQSSIADSRQDLSSLASSSRTSLRDSGPRGRNSLEFFPRTATRPLQESRKFNSLSSISHHQRERSAPVIGRHSEHSQESRLQSQDALPVDTRSHRSGSHREASSASEASPPKSPPSEAGVRSSGQVAAQLESVQPGSRSAFAASHHARMESSDSVFSEPSSLDHRERSGSGAGRGSGADSGAAQSATRGPAMEVLSRKLSMKKAYGIYDEGDRPLHSPTKDPKSGGAASSDQGSRSRGSYSDNKQLGQIQEEADSSPKSRDTESERLASESRQILDSWRNDLEKRTGRTQRAPPEPVPVYRSHDSSSRPQRGFDGSIDSGVGSEISSRTDSQLAPSESFLAIEKASGAELKKLQQQAVLNFVQRKTGRPSLSSASAEHSPESSLYESIDTPRTPHSPTSETVSDLISKTNETLAKRDSIRRSGSTSSRASSSDYVDMNRPDRSRKETEWSRLRSSGSFHYASNRSSLCSDNTYEDISVFATLTPRDSTQEVPKDAEVGILLSLICN